MAILAQKRAEKEKQYEEQIEQIQIKFVDVRTGD